MHPLKYVDFVSLQYYCSTSQKIPMAHPQDPCLLPAARAQPTPTERAQSRRLGGGGKDAESGTETIEKKHGHRVCDRGHRQ